jgi:hypothetical protein
MKYIITSGCSYGVIGDCIFNFWNNQNRYDAEHTYLDKNTDDDITVLEMGHQSQSSNYISDSVIYATEFLLKKGVNSEDIQVIVEWTEPTRIDLPLSNFASKKLIDRQTKKSIPWGQVHPFKVFSKPHIIHEWTDEFELSYFDNGNSIVFLENKPYVVPHHTHIEDDDVSLVVDLDNTRKIYKNLSIEIMYSVYIEQILKLQNFLENHNIKYKFLSIYNVFSSYVKNSDNILIDIKQSLFNVPNVKSKFYHNVKEFNNYKKLSQLDSSFISNNFIEIKSKIDKIKLENWWFYKEFGYGGIDEFAMDKFKEIGYYSGTGNTPKNKENHLADKNIFYNQIPKFINHPARWVYDFILDEILDDTFFVKMNKKWISHFDSYLKEVYDGTKYDIDIISKEEFKKYGEVELYE